MNTVGFILYDISTKKNPDTSRTALDHGNNSLHTNTMQNTQ